MWCSCPQELESCPQVMYPCMGLHDFLLPLACIRIPMCLLAAGAQSPACMAQVPTAQINTSAPFSVAFLDMVRPDSGAARRVFLVTSARFVSFGAVTGMRLRLQSN